MAPLDIGKLYAEFSRQRDRHCSMPSAVGSSAREPDACASNSRQCGVQPGVKQAACQTHLLVVDPKEIKQVLKRAIVSSMFELLSRHESRAHARERWLLKRLKKTLGKFEHRMASLMGKSLAADEQLQQQQLQNLKQLQPKSSPTAGAVPSSEGVSTARQRQRSQRLRHHPGSLETATCMLVQDSETACNIGAFGANRVGAPGIASPISGQSNCNNNNNCDINSNNNNVININCNSRAATADSDYCIIRRQIRQTGQNSMNKRQLLPSSRSQGSTRTTCSVDSITESGVEPAFSGYNVSTSSPFPRFPSNANCNHGTQKRLQPQQQQQQQQQKQQQQRQQKQRRCTKPLQAVQLQPPRPAQAQKIYAEIESEGISGSDDNAAACRASRQSSQQQQQQQQQQQRQSRQTPPKVNIYTPSRPSASTIHRARPGVCQCHAAAEAASDDNQQQQQQPQQQHRCTRCSTKPRPCPRRRKKPQPKKPRSKRRPEDCIPGEASCGDCRPPRLVLCPAPAGRENFSRVRLQTQPGRYITRQVLFFDGSRLYGPAQPRGPCY